MPKLLFLLNQLKINKKSLDIKYIHLYITIDMRETNNINEAKKMTHKDLIEKKEYKTKAGDTLEYRGTISNDKKLLFWIRDENGVVVSDVGFSKKSFDQSFATQIIE